MLIFIIQYHINPAKKANLLGQENYLFAKDEKLLMRKEFTRLKLVSASHDETAGCNQ